MVRSSGTKSLFSSFCSSVSLSLNRNFSKRATVSDFSDPYSASSISSQDTSMFFDAASPVSDLMSLPSSPKSPLFTTKLTDSAAEASSITASANFGVMLS